MYYILESSVQVSTEYHLLRPVYHSKIFINPGGSAKSSFTQESSGDELIEIDSGIEEVCPTSCKPVERSSNIDSCKSVKRISNSNQENNNKEQDLSEPSIANLLFINESEKVDTNKNNRRACPLKRKLELEFSSPNKVQNTGSDQSKTRFSISIKSPSKLMSVVALQQIRSQTMLGSFSYEVENPVGTDMQDILDIAIDPIFDINVSDIAQIESQMITCTENNNNNIFTSSDIAIDTSDSNINDSSDSEAILIEKLIQKKEEDFNRLLRLVGSNFVYKAKGLFIKDVMQIKAYLCHPLITCIFLTNYNSCYTVKNSDYKQ